MADPIHIPVLRAGVEYDSLEKSEVRDFATGEVLALVSQANAGLVRRDLRKIGKASEALRAIPAAKLIEMCVEAAGHYLEGTLPLNAEGATQSPDDYVRTLSRTSGLPHTLCRANMRKIAKALREMPAVLRGLTRGMDPAVIDEGFGQHAGVDVCYSRKSDSLGVVLPSNSPGVNSIWIPAIALKTPVVLKPGREEPWTPLRIAQALIAAGIPREAFSMYPTDHEGAAAILELCGASQLFGDASTTAAYASNPNIELHGPGWSKVLIGADEAPNWERYLDVLVDSVAANGGRSCINASAIFTTSHGDELAAALGARLAEMVPRPSDDPDAILSAFANPKMAEFIQSSIENGLAAGGARDVCAEHRSGPRAVELDGAQYLLPTVVRCDSVEHPLANTEFLFPFASVVELPQDEMLEVMGPTLVATAITRDEGFRRALVASPKIDRLNLGPVPTSVVEWDQPHEGNLFEALYQRRAIQRLGAW